MFLVIDIVVLFNSFPVLTYCFLFLLSFPVIPLSLLFLLSFPGYSFLLFFSRCFVPVISFLLFHFCFFRSHCFRQVRPVRFSRLQPSSDPDLMRQGCRFICPSVFSLLRCPRSGSSRMPGRLPHRQGFPQSPPLPRSHRSLRKSHRRRVLS